MGAIDIRNRINEGLAEQAVHDVVYQARSGFETVGASDYMRHWYDMDVTPREALKRLQIDYPSIVLSYYFEPEVLRGFEGDIKVFRNKLETLLSSTRRNLTVPYHDGRGSIDHTRKWTVDEWGYLILNSTRGDISHDPIGHQKAREVLHGYTKQEQTPEDLQTHVTSYGQALLDSIDPTVADVMNAQVQSEDMPPLGHACRAFRQSFFGGNPPSHLVGKFVGVSAAYAEDVNQRFAFDTFDDVRRFLGDKSQSVSREIFFAKVEAPNS